MDELTFESFFEYFQYLEKNKAEFPKHIYEFAIDEERHNLRSPHSLHDAWISSILIKEVRNKERPFDSHSVIELLLLGPMHDRDFHIKYEGIHKYEVHGNKNPYNWNDTLHGDILQHEIIKNEDQLFVHRLIMSSSSSIEIVCSNIIFEEKEHIT